VVVEMPLSAEDARYRVLGCVDLNDNQKAELLLLINPEPNKTVPIFTGVPDSLLALILTKHLEGLTAGAIPLCTVSCNSHQSVKSQSV